MESFLNTAFLGLCLGWAAGHLSLAVLDQSRGTSVGHRESPAHLNGRPQQTHQGKTALENTRLLKDTLEDAGEDEFG